MEFWLDANYTDLQLGRSPIIINVDAVVINPTDADRSNLRYVLEVWVQNGYRATDFVQVAELMAREEPILAGATLSQGAFFRIEERLVAELSVETPTVSANSRFQVLSGSTRQYYTIAKRYNGSTPIDSVTSVTAWVVDAGLSTADFRDWGTRFFSDFMGSGRRFLTWQADRKVIGRQQREWLYFLSNFTPLPQALKLWRRQVKYNEPDADDPSGYRVIDETVDSIEGVSPFTVYGIDVRVNDLPDNISTVIYWLTNENDEIVSERRTYVISDDAVRNEQNLIFENSLGGFDTLRLLGDLTESMSLQRVVSVKWAGWNFAAEFTEREISDVRGIKEILVTTGYLSKVQQKWLSDMALSRKFWLLREKGLIGLEPAFSNYLIGDSRDQASGRLLAFREMSELLSFSNLPNSDVLEAFAWRMNRTSCGLDGFGRRNGQKVVLDLELYDITTNEVVRPRRVEANVANHPGYIAPFLNSICDAASTPFSSAEISRMGTFLRDDCGAGFQGAAAATQVSIAMFGSELSQADADAKAEAAWMAKNTQAYANEFGNCIAYADGLKSDWYNFSPNDETNAFTGAIAATRTDAELDFSDLESQLPAGVNSDYFAVRWTGKIIGPISGTVTFSMRHDNGLRLWVDDELVIDRFTTTPFLTSEAAMTLIKGKLHKIKIEFFEETGAAMLVLRWRYAGQNTIVVPGANLRN